MASKQAGRKQSVQAKPAGGSKSKSVVAASPKRDAAKRASALVKIVPVKKGSVNKGAVKAAVVAKSSKARAISAPRMGAAPIMKDVPASMPAQNWPQAMSSGGSAVAHASNGKTVSEHSPATMPAKMAMAVPDIASAATVAIAQAVAGRPALAAFEMQAAMFRNAVRYAPMTLAVKGALRGQAMLLRMMQTSSANDRSKT